MNRLFFGFLFFAALPVYSAGATGKITFTRCAEAVNLTNYEFWPDNPNNDYLEIRPVKFCFVEIEGQTGEFIQTENNIWQKLEGCGDATWYRYRIIGANTDGIFKDYEDKNDPKYICNTPPKDAIYAGGAMVRLFDNGEIRFESYWHSLTARNLIQASTCTTAPSSPQAGFTCATSKGEVFKRIDGGWQYKPHTSIREKPYTKAYLYAETWYDESRLGASNVDDAAFLCVRRSFKYLALPTLEEFAEAEKYGIREVFKDMKDRFFAVDPYKAEARINQFLTYNGSTGALEWWPANQRSDRFCSNRTCRYSPNVVTRCHLRDRTEIRR